MKTVALSEAKDKLSALVDEADSTHEMITITKHGHAAAVLMSAEDLESLHETLHWLSQPYDVRREIEEARAEHATGHTVSGDDLRARYGLSAK